VATNGGFVTTPPAGTVVPNWDTGWAQPANEPQGTYVTGWDYVGQVGGGPSGTYLGDGWVLTAAHVGAANFSLDNQTYDLVPNSAVGISGGSVDLTLFQISTTSLNGTLLDLPTLTLSSSDPTPFSYRHAGSQVVMIGYGVANKSWGLNTITNINISVTPDGMGYVSNDFFTLTGTTTVTNWNGTRSKSIVNNAQLVGGDSGGGDFIYNVATGQWELAGINEVNGTDDDNQELSGFVQVDTYAQQIESITGIPGLTLAATSEPSTWLLVLPGCLLLLYWRLRPPCQPGWWKSKTAAS
jgi:hypothetical protein